MRLGPASRLLNVGHNTILDFLAKKGHTVENNPNAKLTAEQVALVSKEFASSASEKQEASGLTIGGKHSEPVTFKPSPEPHRKKEEEQQDILIKNLGSKELKHKEEPIVPEKITREKTKLEGLKVVGKLEEPEKKKKEPEPETIEIPVVKAPEPPVEEKEVKPEQELELIKAKAD